MYRHLKYGLPMINDVVRNSFYNKILQQVKDKNCLEIGFGSGILSILALQHGARSIVAYEECQETFELGKKIIQSLGLEDKITLIGEQFTSEKIKQHPKIDLIFTETINHTLWGESLLDIVDKNLPLILPNKYFLELYLIEIEQNYARRLIQNDNKICNPGVNVDSRYTDEINQLLGNKNQSLLDGLYDVDLGQRLYQILELFNIKNRSPDASYVVDINNPPDTKNIFKWNKDLDHKKSYLILPRTGMSVDDKKLYTDICDNWGPFARYPVILNAQGNFQIEQNFKDGNFVYTYEDQKIYLIKEETSQDYSIKENRNTKVVNFVH